MERQAPARHCFLVVGGGAALAAAVAVLRAAGHRVVAAPDADYALIALGGVRFDAILTAGAARPYPAPVVGGGAGRQHAEDVTLAGACPGACDAGLYPA